MASWWPGVVAGAVTGVGSGFLAALVTPWATWAVEKRRGDRQRQVELVKSWRDLVARYLGGRLNPDYLLDPEYLTIRPHLSAEAREELEGGGRPTVVSPGATPGLRSNHLLRVLDEEITRIERAWGLAP